jgi:hypothetical protein
MLSKLIENIMMIMISIGKLFGNGTSYEGMILNLGNNEILPCIKVREKARVRWKR